MIDKIAYIGASGFVGTKLIELTKDQFNIINIDKNNSKHFEELTVIADIRNKKELQHKFIGVNTIVLLAAEHRNDVYPVSLYYDVNVQGTINILEAIDNNGIKNVIFTSSVAVYGLNKQNPSELNPVDPFNHYGKSKLQAEEALKKWYFKDPKNRFTYYYSPNCNFWRKQ